MHAFKFIDGKLVELNGFKNWPVALREMVVEKFNPRLVPVTLTPRMRRFYARKGRPRRQSKRVAKHSIEWRFPMISHAQEVVWEGHRIATTDEPRYPWLEPVRRIVCIVYLPKGKEVDDEVLRAVELWEARRQYDAEMKTLRP